MPPSFTAGVRDSLSNLAASLGAGKDKAAYDSFVLFDLDRGQIESMYRGDWLARKVVDIVPYDTVREWREWSGHRDDVVRVEAAERRLGLRKALQRALVLGRLYGGGAIVIGTGETDPAALARPLDPEALPRGGVQFLHAVSRWQLAAPMIDRDPLSPWFGEAVAYEVVTPGRGSLRLHPSRVVRFLGNEWPDPTVGASVWSDSVLLALYDAIHAVALTTAGATSLMHEAKVDVVTVPNLSEHLSSADTTAQLSARFAYAAAMKSINNLLLLGDGETWARQRIDFAGLPEMVRTFLQVAAGAADIPVTRLLGQSPAGLSATGDSDTRNYYDMISARQEVDLRPQLERLDRLILRSEGIDPAALTFTFRPLWQMDAASQADVALAKAQATAVYAGLGLWPAHTTARLVESQLIEDGVYPNAATIFADVGTGATDPGGPNGGDASGLVADYFPAQPRDPDGRWTEGSGALIISAGFHLEKERRRKKRDRRRRERARERDNEKGAEVRHGGSEKQGDPRTGTPEVRPPQQPIAPQPPAATSEPLSSAPARSPEPSLAHPTPPTVFKPAGIPDNWIERPTRRKGGLQWSDPKNDNNVVRSMPADPDSPYSHQQVPYIVDQNGAFMDVNGQPVSGSKRGGTPRAHIPASDFTFKRP